MSHDLIYIASLKKPAGNDPCGYPCPGAGPAKINSTKREGVAEARPEKCGALDTKVNKKAASVFFNTQWADASRAEDAPQVGILEESRPNNPGSINIRDFVNINTNDSKASRQLPLQLF